MSKTELRGLLQTQWAMKAEALAHMAESIQGILDINAAELAESLDGFPEDPEDEREIPVEDGTARLQIRGVMLKTVPRILKFFGIGATSTDDLQEDLARLETDGRVERVILDIDSPGGTVNGTFDLANAVRDFSKPIAVEIQDLAASAALWVATQADFVDAGELSNIGSIGVYTVMVDSSRAADDAGVKVHVISSGSLKGGAPGAPISEAQLADTQRLIDQIAAKFVKAVVEGRNMVLEDVQELATGQVWLAEDALVFGLIDHVRSSGQPRSTITTPDGVEEQSAMPKELDAAALAADLEVANARIAAVDAALAEAQGREKDRILAQYVDRYAPAEAPALQSLATKISPVELEEILSVRPAIVKVDRVTVDTDQILEETPAGEKVMNRAVCKSLGISTKTLDKFGEFAGIDIDGNLLTEAEVL